MRKLEKSLCFCIRFVVSRYESKLLRTVFMSQVVPGHVPQVTGQSTGMVASLEHELIKSAQLLYLSRHGLQDSGTVLDVVESTYRYFTSRLNLLNLV